jgi:hypothetical protein
MAAWESAPLVTADAPAWQSAPLVDGPPATTPNDISGEGRDEYGNPRGPLGPAGPAASFPSIQEMRQGLEPTPGWVSSGILPIATKEVSPGQGDPSAGIKLDWGPVRAVVNPLLDLLEGTGLSDAGDKSPLAGKVSPEATNLLLGAALGGGLTSSVARGTGTRIAETADFGAPKSVLYGDRSASPATIPTTTVRPDTSAPQPGMGAAQPTEAAGAQVSTAAQAEMTPAEIAAYRATAEGRTLLETQQPGIRDDRELIPGVAASHAEIEQTVQTARELKNAGQKVPEVGQQAQEIADANNDARVRYHEDTIGSPVDINNATVARDAQGEADRAAAFAHAGEANAQPVLDMAAEIQRSPQGRRPAVRRALDSVTQELAADDQGNLYTDPQQLYGVRQHIGDLLSKEGAATDPLSMRAKSALLQLRDTLDQAIEAAAPGFRQYLDNFSAASRRIEEMQVLQDHHPKLFMAGNRLSYAKFQQMMRQIVDSRMNADPISPYKSISDETMVRLWRLRDDLRRSASAKELAAAAGSDSAQNIWSAARSAAGGMGGTAAAAIAGHALGGPLGGIVSGVGKSMLENVLSARTLRPIEPAPIGRRNPLAPD